ncbi:MAG: FAD-dependent oxidoreductase [Aggregatilineales bacterium]
MTISHWQADGTQPHRDVDVLIVGAGIVGCSAAYFAAQAGREVVITEMRDVGLGASGRNAGFMITGLDTYYNRAIEHYGHNTVRELWALSKTTHGYWQDFAAKGNVKLDRCGSMLLAESAEEAEELRLSADALHADGIEVIYHDHDPLGRGYFAAIEQPWDCAVQPYELARAVCQQSGAELIANNELYGYEQTAQGVTVYTHRVIFHARKVLLCTNAYSPRIDPFFAGKVVPTRAQCLVTEPLETPLLNTCGYSDYGYMYYRMTFDNRLLIGGGRKNYKPLENDTTEDRTTPEVQGALDNYLTRFFPEVTAPVARRWSGIMGFTPDKIPLVGTLPDKPDIGFAVGFTGHGLAFGAGTAERAVDHLLTGASVGALDARRTLRHLD